MVHNKLELFNIKNNILKFIEDIVLINPDRF